MPHGVTRTAGGKDGYSEPVALYFVRFFHSIPLLVSGTEAMQSDAIATYRGVVIFLDWHAEGEPPFLRHHGTYRCEVQGQSLTAQTLPEIKQAIDRHYGGSQETP